MPTKILIVEDEPILVSLYTTVLTQAGYDVKSASDGQTGEEQVVITRPHVVLLDLLIPKNNASMSHVGNLHEPVGFEILRLVKGTPSLQEIRVIVLSNLDSDEHVRTATELGADAYIVKANLDPHLLKIRVEEVLHSTGPAKKAKPKGK